MWLRTRFVSEDEEAEDVLTPLTAYEWTGTGSPCLADPDLPPDHEDNEIIGSDNSLDEPEENGTLTVEIVKWSFVPGYEPDISDPENAQPNGFPDPNWAPA